MPDCLIGCSFLFTFVFKQPLNIRIGEIRGDKVQPIHGNFDKFTSQIKLFASSSHPKIKSAKQLTKLMASKAKLLADTISEILTYAQDTDYGSLQLRGQFDAFKNVLIHDISVTDFADIYAQTIAYGMFAARLHDTIPENFSRQKAATLIPKTTPFLRQIFQSIAGYDLDERIAWIVDDLATAFCHTDMNHVLQGYGANNRHSDPMIHFYEDFLTVYNPKSRKSKGVWYTPAPIVNFIIKSVDEILQRDFNLPMGLADYSQAEHEIINENYDPKKHYKPTIKQKFHKVQILDPAVGTGTFLAETINCIYDKFTNTRGMWQGYVEEHLLPRLNGFELLMAPYAIAHMKIDWLLNATGYNNRLGRRVRIYLTNSLEECHKDVGTLFSQWLSIEANEASRVKRDTPVMVVVGNPPYNGSSTNKNPWINDLLNSYKKEPGCDQILKERNSKWLNDDYVKFIRMAQYFIEKNGKGILAFITPHGFLDNPTFRGMRWELLRVFDSIYTLDLHGNSKKKETTPDGSKDENVFDIMQGVSINFFIKSGKKKDGQPGNIYHHELFGLREEKFNYLTQNCISSVPYIKLHPQHPMFFFVPKNFSLQKEYNAGFKVNELFPLNSVGIVTTKDAFLICDTPTEVTKRINDLITLPETELRKIYGLKDTRDWSIQRAKNDVGSSIDASKITEIDYRWGDRKFLYYTGLTNGIVARPRFRSLSPMLASRNFALLTVRQIAGNDWCHVSISDTLVDDCRVSNKTKERGYVFPLFTYPGEAGSNFEQSLIPNLNTEITSKIEHKIQENIIPLELFDYIYGCLHSNSYRKKYNEFLKTDFPRIPYPKSAEEYHTMASIGTELRNLHLFQDSKTWVCDTEYPNSGSDIVENIKYENGKVWINDTQYFGGIPQNTWELLIGGYQPAQKWLKDHKGKKLVYTDIRHYCEIIYALKNSLKYIAALDKIKI